MQIACPYPPGSFDNAERSGYTPFHGADGRLPGALLASPFLPLATLAFAFAVHPLSGTGGVSAFGWLLTGLAVPIDIGPVGRGRSGLGERRRGRVMRKRER